MDYVIEKLEVYFESEKFSDEIWEIVGGWDNFKKETIGKQLVRAADSISANIAEGYGRYYYKESKQFYYYARGSIQETKAWLSKCLRRKIINPDDAARLIEKGAFIMFKLNAYIKFVRNSPKHSEEK